MRILLIGAASLLLVLPACSSGKRSTPSTGVAGVNSQAGQLNPPQDDHGNDSGNTTTAHQGLAVAGRIGPTPSGGAPDEDWFSFEMTVGKYYQIRTDTLGDTSLTILDSRLTMLEQNNDEDAAAGKLNSLVGMVAPATGTYFAVVRGDPETRYSLLVQ